MLMVNYERVDTITFPDGTTQVLKLPQSEASVVEVVWKYKDMGEIVSLLHVDALLRAKQARARLTITYLPFARQDKDIEEGSFFALYPFAEILKTMTSFDKIVVHHPHSSVLKDILGPDRLEEEYGLNMFIIQDFNIIYPDAGALKRYVSLVGEHKNYAVLSKNRDPKTGHIVGLTIVDDFRDRSKPSVIVDDICDGGATFIQAAKLLNDQDLRLYVVHGIFSKGVEVLKEAGITQIYAHDTLDKEYPEGVEIVRSV